MTRPEGTPIAFFRDASIAVARQSVAEAEAIDYATAGYSVLAGHIGALSQAVRDLLEVIDAQQGASHEA